MEQISTGSLPDTNIQLPPSIDLLLSRQKPVFIIPKFCIYQPSDKLCLDSVPRSQVLTTLVVIAFSVAYVPVIKTELGIEKSYTDTICQKLNHGFHLKI